MRYDFGTNFGAIVFYVMPSTLLFLTLLLSTFFPPRKVNTQLGQNSLVTRPGLESNQNKEEKRLGANIRKQHFPNI
jgi:hypothetical protein